MAGHQIVVHGAGTVEGFDVATGKKEWWVTALSNGTSTPAVSGDVVYVSTWSALGESGDQWPTLPDFAAAVAQYDADHSGTLSGKELPADLYIFRRPETGGVPGADVSVRMMFGGFDSNDDGAIDAKEWAAGIEGWKGRRAEHGLIAVKTGGQGDVTASNVLWREKSSIPEVPSPLFYQDRVYLVRNGGIVSCLDAASGRTVYRARLGAPGPYYSSPIEAGGRVIVGSGDGTVVVFKAGDALDVLSRNDLGEPIFATPAVSNGVLYVRTASALSAFSQH